MSNESPPSHSNIGNFNMPHAHAHERHPGMRIPKVNHRERPPIIATMKDIESDHHSNDERERERERARDRATKEEHHHHQGHEHHEHPSNLMMHRMNKERHSFMNTHFRNFDGMPGGMNEISTYASALKGAKQPTYNIFVKNLPRDCAKFDLRQAFGKYGEIFSCAVVRRGGRHSATVPSKAFGFVNFLSREAQDRAVRESGSISIKENVIECEVSTTTTVIYVGNIPLESPPDTVRFHVRKFGGPYQALHVRHGHCFVVYDSYYKADSAIRKLQNTKIDDKTIWVSIASETKAKMLAGFHERPQNRTLHIAGVGDITEHELKDFFKGYGLVVSVRIPRDNKTHNNKGYAFVEFGNSGDAELAKRGEDGKSFASSDIMKISWCRGDGNHRPTHYDPAGSSMMPRRFYDGHHSRMGQFPAEMSPHLMGGHPHHYGSSPPHGHYPQSFSMGSSYDFMPVQSPRRSRRRAPRVRSAYPPSLPTPIQMEVPGHPGKFVPVIPVSEFLHQQTVARNRGAYYEGPHPSRVPMHYGAHPRRRRHRARHSHHKTERDHHRSRKKSARADAAVNQTATDSKHDRSRSRSRSHNHEHSSRHHRSSRHRHREHRHSQSNKHVKTSSRRAASEGRTNTERSNQPESAARHDKQSASRSVSRSDSMENSVSSVGSTKSQSHASKLSQQPHHRGRHVHRHRHTYTHAPGNDQRRGYSRSVSKSRSKNSASLSGSHSRSRSSDRSQNSRKSSRSRSGSRTVSPNLRSTSLTPNTSNNKRKDRCKSEENVKVHSNLEDVNSNSVRNTGTTNLSVFGNVPNTGQPKAQGIKDLMEMEDGEEGEVKK